MRLHARTLSKVPALRFRGAGGFALVFIIVMLAVLALLASVIVPDLVKRTMLDHAENEAVMLDLVGAGLKRYTQRTHAVPGVTNWVDAVVRETGISRVEVTQVYPRYPTDLNTQRVYLIDPNWTPGTGSSLLPYYQSPGAVTYGTTNAPTLKTRLMLVSNTRRELSLPLSSGTPSASEFTAVWDWIYNPETKEPPSGWPATWSGRADGLHVERLDLAEHFHTLTLKNLQYSLDGSYPVEIVTDEVRRQMLRGSLLKVFHPNGQVYASYIVTKDRSFDLTPLVFRALLYFKLDEASGALGLNSGKGGSIGDLTYYSSPIIGVAGPSSLPDSNLAIKFNGNGDRAGSSYYFPNPLPEFTLAAWIHPTGLMGNNEGILGERDVVYFESKDKDEITLVTYASGSVTFDYPFPNNTWHHVAAVGDGSTLKIYVDASLVATQSQSVSNYGNPSSAQPFRLAGQIVNGSDYFKGIMDEVVFYDEALVESEISQLYGGTVP